jgi:hypothetical protein
MSAQVNAKQEAFYEALYRATGIHHRDAIDKLPPSINGVEQTDPATIKYWATYDRVSKEYPDTASDEEWDEIADAVSDIADEIAEYEPTTLAGLGVVARAQTFS